MDWSQHSSLKCINCFEQSFPSVGRNTLRLHDWSLYDMSVKVLARDDHTLRAGSQFSETFCPSLPLLVVSDLIASQADNKSVLSPPCGAADALFIQLMRIWDFQENCGGILRGLHHFCKVSPTPACFRQSGVWISNCRALPFLLLQVLCSTRESCGYFVCLSVWGFFWCWLVWGERGTREGWVI